MDYVKGIFRKCTDKVFNMLTSNLNYLDDLDDFFYEIINTNRDDREGLLWFFDEIGKRAPVFKDYYK